MAGGATRPSAPRRRRARLGCDRRSTSPRLAGTRRRVGLTTTPISQISHDRHIDTLFSVLDAQAVDRCVLAGHSVNASVALEAVLRQPERFDGLVLANGHAWDMDRPEVRGFVEALRTDFAPTVEFFTHLVFPEPNTETARTWLNQMMHRTGPDACARILESKYSVDLRSRLGEVTIPTLVVHGSLDAVSPDSLGEATTFAREIPDATLHVIEEAGHMPLLSRPEAFADAVAAFLTHKVARVPSTAGALPDRTAPYQPVTPKSVEEM